MRLFFLMSQLISLELPITKGDCHSRRWSEGLIRREKIRYIDFRDY